jgi:outer membrane protein assembly factor BamB
MRRALLLILLILASSAFASQLWQFATDGAISVKPVAYQGAVVAASDDGNIYAVEIAGVNAGNKRWMTNVGKTPNEAFVFDNAVVVSSFDGRVSKVGPSGNVLWSVNLNTSAYNATAVYGAVANQQFIFVTASNGVYELDGSGNVKLKLISFNDSILGPPSAGPDYVVFGKGSELYKVSQSGTVLWKTPIVGGSFWSSRPMIDGSGIYIGATDNRLHYFAASNGAHLWSVQTRGWIASTPLVSGGAIYFGSDDGKVYSVDPYGSIIWTAQTQLAIQTQPEMGVMGGKEVVFVGGSDKSIYAISTRDGEIVWKGPSDSAVGNPLFFQNSVIFGSGEGRLYAYSSERACSITNPHEADVVGLKELAVSGNFVSEAGGATVYVQFNEGGWQQAKTSDTEWVYYLNPKTSLNPALNTISCKVSDANGDENGPSFTTVVVNHDNQAPLSEFNIAITPNIIEKNNFTVYVNDGDDGSPVDRFTLIYNGKNFTSDWNQTLAIAEPGNYPIIIKKMGFKDATINVNVNASGVSPVFLVIGSIVILAIIWYVVGVINKRGKSRKR